jgi:hypothetical protein
MVNTGTEVTKLKKVRYDYISDCDGTVHCQRYLTLSEGSVIQGPCDPNLGPFRVPADRGCSMEVASRDTGSIPH